MTRSLVTISAVLIAVMAIVVGAGGFEPPTSTLSVLRSNQLSYAPLMRGPFPLKGRRKYSTLVGF